MSAPRQVPTWRGFLSGILGSVSRGHLLAFDNSPAGLPQNRAGTSVIAAQKAAQAVLDEQLFVATDKFCQLQEQAVAAGRADPVHAELRRTLEHLADLQRELRALERVSAVKPEAADRQAA
jgi:hypothetical protein